MKRLSSLLILTLTLSACNFGSLHPTLFNNRVVELVNPTTLAIEESALTYNSVVPDELTELSLVETDQLRLNYDEALELLEDSNKALNYESENLEQQATVRGHLETYISAGSEYLEAYEAMLIYFEDASHMEDPNRLDDLDPTLHAAYNTFTEANNDLVTSLAEFVKTETPTE